MSLINILNERIQEFHIPNHINGVVQLTVDNKSELNQYFNFTKYVSINKGVTEHYDTQILLPLEALERIVQSPDTFDTRDAFFTERVRVTGNLKLMHYFTQLLKRPAPIVIETLNQIRGRKYKKIDHVEQVKDLNTKIILSSIIESYPIHGVNAIDWDIINWSLDELEEKLGDFVLRKNTVTGQIEYFSDFMQLFRKSKGERVYTNGYTIPEDLCKHFNLPFFDSSMLRPAQIWFGRNSQDKTITKLHCDFVSSLLVQIWGTKKLYLYPPDQHEYLYPIQSYNHYQPCLVDPSDYQREIYPEYVKATPIEVILSPRDMLVIPAGWYHCVWALDDTFSISRFIEQETAAELQKALVSIS